MFTSIRAKFILYFGSLIVILFLGLGLYLQDAKEKEFTAEVTQNTQFFARLVIEDVVQSYERYLAPGNYIAFQREVQKLLKETESVSSFQLITYDGKILYDSEIEATERFKGPERLLMDLNMQERVQSQALSIDVPGQKVRYVELDQKANPVYLDFNQKAMQAPDEKDRVRTIVMPHENHYAAVFTVNYDQVNAQLVLIRKQIAAAAAIGILLALTLSYLLSSSITRPLQQLKERALLLAKGDFKARVKIQSRDEVGVLGQTFNKMAEELESSTDARVYQERVKKELELATQIQAQLLPKSKLVLKKADLSGGLIPATEVGGDAFDYIPVNTNQVLAYIGDVTGHGVPAGIISSVANALFYGLKSHGSLLEIVETLNEIIQKKTLERIFLTMGLLFWDEKSSTIEYLSAGHPPLLFYEAKTKTVTEFA